ncbi:MAG: rhomboid family intramembrane serine protease [Bacteroidia bacterium]|nr:rhomboid family intramembrane serine protease [Bacteroidia bacterium]
MKVGQKRLITAGLVIGAVTCLLFLVQFLQISGIDVWKAGIYPKKWSGLAGILTAPWIHANWEHLLANIISLVSGLAGMILFYPKQSLRTILLITFFGGFLVWLLARPTYHIGASGVIYGIFSFLLFSGIFRRDKPSIAVSFLVILTQGGFWWGIFPSLPSISWESHLYGFLIGLYMAYSLRKESAQIEKMLKKPTQSSDDIDYTQGVWDYKSKTKSIHLPDLTIQEHREIS